MLNLRKSFFIKAMKTHQFNKTLMVLAINRKVEDHKHPKHTRKKGSIIQDNPSKELNIKKAACRLEADIAQTYSI